MTIYNQISANKLRSFFIIILFVIIVTGFFYVLSIYSDSSQSILIGGLLFSLFSTGISYFYSDKIILFTVRAHPADKKQYFDFYTVAENLSIASGLPMPKLYVIDDPSPNAFATGRDPKHAVICVTTGLLNKLDRLEIEGVIAHELSHVKNYDILLASVVAVLVGTIAQVSQWIMWPGMFGPRISLSRNNNNDRKNPFMFFVFLLVLIIMPISAMLIQLSLSRRREFLADADGALLTRYPEGLAKALEKIAADPDNLRSVSAGTAHLFISNPLAKQSVKNKLAGLFSTHPPIQERIRILRSM